jgi:hypothetical protein
MTKSNLNIGLLATTFFLCSLGAGLAIPVSLYHNNNNETGMVVNVDNNSNATHDLNASLTVNATKSEIVDYESEQWRDVQSDHGYKHDMMMHPVPVSGRKLLRRLSPPPAPPGAWRPWWPPTRSPSRPGWPRARRCPALPGRRRTS